MELWRIELQSENKLPTASTCLEKLFGLTLIHTTCKATQSEPRVFVPRRDTRGIYRKKGDTSESFLFRVGRRSSPNVELNLRYSVSRTIICVVCSYAI